MIQNIEEVYASLPTRKRVLDGILNFLSVPRSVAELAEEVARLQEYSKSVYTSANYSAILEQAGAIQKCTAEGAPLDGTLSPEVVELDGVAYYRPLGFHQVHWKATSEGAAAVASNNPLAKLQSLFEQTPAICPYTRRCSKPAMWTAEPPPQRWARSWTDTPFSRTPSTTPPSSSTSSMLQRRSFGVETGS